MATDPMNMNDSRPSTIPDEARLLIANAIDSVLVLEVLLLFYHHPEHEWTEDELARELRVAQAWTELRLVTLVRAGLLAEEKDRLPKTFRYYPASMEINASVAALARSYSDRPDAVISLIHSRLGRRFWRFWEL